MKLSLDLVPEVFDFREGLALEAYVKLATASSSIGEAC